MKKILLVFISFLLVTNPSFASEVNNSNSKNEFKPYLKELKNQKLSSDIFESESIKIIRNKYELKRQASEFAKGYEYLITNKTNKTIVLQEMGSSSIFNRSEISNRVNELKPVDFIPVYSYYDWIKSIGEYRKFTKPFPFNYSIEPNKTIRILLLGRKNITPAVKFQFIVNNSTETLITDSQNNRFKDYTEKDYYKSQIRSYNIELDAKGMIKCINKEKTNLVKAFSKSEIEAEKKINGQPPILYALVKNQPEAAALLLSSGANPNATYIGKPVLEWAIIRNRPEIAKLLIDYGANINGNKKKSPLNFALARKRMKIAEYLLNAGAKVDKKTVKYAQNLKDEHIKNLILSKSK